MFMVTGGKILKIKEWKAVSKQLAKRERERNRDGMSSTAGEKNKITIMCSLFRIKT